MVGDFNFHLEDAADSHAARFRSVLAALGLVQHVQQATHLNGHLLDLVISRETDSFVSGCRLGDLFSDHFSVFATVRAHRPVLPIRCTETRRLPAIDYEAFLADVRQCPFVSDPPPSLPGLVSRYQSDLGSLLDRHAPLVKRRIHLRPSCPWFTGRIASARKECRRAERVWRGRGLEVDRQILAAARASLSRTIFDEKTAFLRGKVEEGRLAGRSLFSVLDTHVFGGGGRRLRLPSHQSREQLASDFSRYFHEKIASIRSALDRHLGPVCVDEACVSRPVPKLDLFDPVTPQEVVDLIRACPPKSSTLDPVPATVLKRICIALAPSLALLINSSLAQGVFPDDLKAAILIPLLKKPSLDPEVLGNYRPISLLSFLSKLLERVVLRRLVDHLRSGDLFVPVQSAYRAGHSPETALLKVVSDLRLLIDQGKGAMLTMLDLSSAFDTVDHDVLLSRLQQRFGVTGVALKWFHSYLSGRTQSVRVIDVSSEARALEFGVPQGSVLGPVLFLLYVAPVYDILLRHGIDAHFFADDTQCYTGFSLASGGVDQRVAISRMEHCVSDLGRWFDENRLQNNFSKMLNMYVAAKSSARVPESWPLVIGDAVITPSISVRNLGVVLDSHLSMEVHVGEACRKAYYQLWRIGKMRSYLDMVSCNTLVCSLVFPHLDFANSLLFGLPKGLIGQLQRVQDFAARIVTRAHRWTSSAPLLVRLHWLPVARRILYKVAQLAYRCYHRLAPSYLCDLVSPYRPARALRTEDAHLFVVPRVNRERCGSRSFSFAAPTVWNALPLILRKSPTVDAFSRALKTLLFDPPAETLRTHPALRALLSST